MTDQAPTNPLRNMFVKVTMTEQSPKPNTKRGWVTDDVWETYWDEAHYTNYVQAAPTFRKMGGTETVQKGYTPRGYLPVKIFSTSPGKDYRRIAEFDFDLT